MATQKLCQVAAIEELGPKRVRLILDAPDLASHAHCGQFVHIACGEVRLLRRPISICLVDGARLHLVFQIKGEGTQWLAGRKPGDSLDVLGPLGHGFTLRTLGTAPVFVGGGIGVPPLLYAMRCAAERGATPTAILGFRTRAEVLLESAFAAYGTTVVVTDDGSYGRAGFVTTVLQEYLALTPQAQPTLAPVTGIAACGPRPMLQAVAGLAVPAGIPCQVSLEERMGCGIGACLVCACALRDPIPDPSQVPAPDAGIHYGHVCKDGPVFDAREVVWG